MTDDNKEPEKKIHDFVEAEMEIVDKIIHDETWLEGERRSAPVDENDPTVVERVVEIIDEKADEIVYEAKRRCHKDEDKEEEKK